MTSEEPSSGNIDSLITEILKFRDDRDWAQFHTPRDLATGISIEAAELLELFLWKSADQTRADLQNPVFRENLSHEIADVVIYSLLLAHNADMDVPQIIREKLVHNAQKYPVEQCKGRSTKARDLRKADHPEDQVSDS